VFLFILESLGTQELILIGIVALIFLGPRRLPEMARKLGKILADLKKTSGEFRETWEREVDFEEETKALKLDSMSIDDIETELESERTIARDRRISGDDAPLTLPEVKAIDPSEFEARRQQLGENGSSASDGSDTEAPETTADRNDGSDETDLLSDKRTWL
jgi:sec-independent protein translocase protein TatB